jgi:hypothetical protein
MALDKNRVTLGLQNEVASVTLTSGSWNASFPLTNLKTRFLPEIARSTNLLAASTKFNGVFSSYKTIGMVALANHNLSSAAKWRVRLYYDNGFATLMYDSGVMDVWPTVYLPDQLNWEDNNFWTGQLSDAERSQFTALATNIFENVLAQSFLIEIFDTTNSDGYVQVGRLILSEAWQPTYNMSYGVEFGYINNSTIDQAIDQTEYFNELTPRRTVRFSLKYLTEREAFNRVLLSQRKLGISGEVLFAYNLNITPQYYQRTFLSRYEKPNPILYPYLNKFENDINLLEIV